MGRGKPKTPEVGSKRKPNTPEVGSARRLPPDPKKQVLGHIPDFPTAPQNASSDSDNTEMEDEFFDELISANSNFSSKFDVMSKKGNTTIFNGHISYELTADEIIKTVHEEISPPGDETDSSYVYSFNPTDDFAFIEPLDLEAYVYGDDKHPKSIPVHDMLPEGTRKIAEDLYLRIKEDLRNDKYANFKEANSVMITFGKEGSTLPFHKDGVKESRHIDDSFVINCGCSSSSTTLEFAEGKKILKTHTYNPGISYTAWAMNQPAVKHGRKEKLTSDRILFSFRCFASSVQEEVNKKQKSEKNELILEKNLFIKYNKSLINAIIDYYNSSVVLFDNPFGKGHLNKFYIPFTKIYVKDTKQIDVVKLLLLADEKYPLVFDQDCWSYVSKAKQQANILRHYAHVYIIGDEEFEYSHRGLQYYYLKSYKTIQDEISYKDVIVPCFDVNIRNGIPAPKEHQINFYTKKTIILQHLKNEFLNKAIGTETDEDPVGLANDTMPPEAPEGGTPVEQIEAAEETETANQEETTFFVEFCRDENAIEVETSYVRIEFAIDIDPGLVKSMICTGKLEDCISLKANGMRVLKVPITTGSFRKYLNLQGQTIDVPRYFIDENDKRRGINVFSPTLLENERVFKIRTSVNTDEFFLKLNDTCTYSESMTMRYAKKTKIKTHLFKICFQSEDEYEKVLLLFKEFPKIHFLETVNDTWHNRKPKTVQPNLENDDNEVTRDLRCQGLQNLVLPFSEYKRIIEVIGNTSVDNVRKIGSSIVFSTRSSTNFSPGSTWHYQIGDESVSLRFTEIKKKSIQEPGLNDDNDPTVSVIDLSRKGKKALSKMNPIGCRPYDGRSLMNLNKKQYAWKHTNKAIGIKLTAKSTLIGFKSSNEHSRIQVCKKGDTSWIFDSQIESQSSSSLQTSIYVNHNCLYEFCRPNCDMQIDIFILPPPESSIILLAEEVPPENEDDEM